MGYLALRNRVSNMALSIREDISPDKNVAISVRNLSKKYHLNKFDQAPLLREEAHQSNEKGAREFEALKSVSFDLMNGDVVGIIGSNGSGKTTLLRILSEITKPTSGEALIHGSVTSILDIGSNFHPDLTGHENTLMQLRVRGVPKAEFAEMIRKIRHFSGIEDFFEQPVKYYSNGMFLRLAFSVAFNIPADILILDEVLSVGDEGFRLKSHTLMKQFKYAGKTILFVSHNRNEILELCDKCIWLDKGSIRKIGSPTEVMGEYFEMQRGNYEAEQNSEKGTLAEAMGSQVLNDGVELQWPGPDAPGNDFFMVRNVSITQGGQLTRLFTSDDIEVKITIEKKLTGGSIGALIIVSDVFYQPVLIANLLNNATHENFVGIFAEETGVLELKCTIPGNFLAQGVYYTLVRFGIDAKAGEQNSDHDYHLKDNLKFRLHNKPGNFDFIGGSINGSVRPAFKWSYTKKVN